MKDKIVVKKIRVNSEILKKLVTNYWFLTSYEDININHKILPVRSNDIILNINEPISYTKPSGQTYKVPSMHINSLKTQHHYIHQTGRLGVMGITFNPLGMYPFINGSMREVHNSVGYDKISFQNHKDILLEYLYIGDEENLIKAIENIMLENLNYDLMPEKQLHEIVNLFCSHLGQLKIDNFCMNYGVSKRWLERNFMKYLGVSPKTFLKLCRFQESVNLIKRGTGRDLTTLSHDSNFCDQSHFSNDFKNFTGSSPSKFKKDNSCFKDFVDC